MNATRLKAAAHAYVGQGWSVFPCEPQGKRPLGRLVPHGLKNATTDPAAIDRWWAKVPNANIGLATGIAFDVLDVDDDVGHDILVAEMPLDALTIDGPTVTTGRGFHCYVAPTGLGNRVNFVLGCDWRGVGGYVVAPPSVHPTGAMYRWHLGEDDLDFVVRVPVRPAPAWLLELLHRRRTTPTATTTAGQARSAYGRRALEGEVGKVLLAPVGQRNHALNAAAFSLGQLVAGGVLGVDQVIDALLLAAGRVGLEVSETRKTIASGLRSGAAQPRRVPT